jgi:threonine synthase
LQQGRQGPLDFQVNLKDGVPAGFEAAWNAGPQRNIWRYEDLLPTVEHPLSLDEGGTPLTHLEDVSNALGLKVYIKNETMNPTWSFKDRHAAVNITTARQLGYTKVVASSTGNAGQAVAAYAALAGLRSLIIGYPTSSELLRRVMQIHGASVVTMPKAEIGTTMRQLVEDHGWLPVGSSDPNPLASPYGVTGYKTIGYEVASALGGTPDAVLVPTGGGDSLYGVWRGLIDLREMGLIDRLPRMVGCQTEATHPLLHAISRNETEIEVQPEPDSLATSIIEGRCGVHALRAIYASGGTATAVTEDELRQAVHRMASRGYFFESASLATIASLYRLHGEGYFKPGETVVCVITGSGVKWPDAINQLAPAAPHLERPSMDALADVMEL